MYPYFYVFIRNNACGMQARQGCMMGRCCTWSSMTTRTYRMYNVGCRVKSVECRVQTVGCSV